MTNPTARLVPTTSCILLPVFEVLVYTFLGVAGSTRLDLTFFNNGTLSLIQFGSVAQFGPNGCTALSTKYLQINLVSTDFYTRAAAAQVIFVLTSPAKPQRLLKRRLQ